MHIIIETVWLFDNKYKRFGPPTKPEDDRNPLKPVKKPVNPFEDN
jgi:hypothetical protein